MLEYCLKEKATPDCIMPEFRFAYSIQSWLELAPQGYLEGTVYGHAETEKEPAAVLENQSLREDAIHTTVQLIVGERCALAASSGLINATPNESSKRFLATQTVDEARHVEVFTHRLLDLGVPVSDLDSVIRDRANPNLVKFAGVLLERVHKGDFLAAIVGQNIILEGIALSVFDTMQEMVAELNPKLAHSLSGIIADERRHVGLGESTIGALLRGHHDRLPSIEKMHEELTHYIIAAFSDIFRDTRASAEHARNTGGRRQQDSERLETALTARVVSDLKTRLERIAIDSSPG